LHLYQKLNQDKSGNKVLTTEVILATAESARGDSESRLSRLSAAKDALYSPLDIQ